MLLVSNPFDEHLQGASLPPPCATLHCATWLVDAALEVQHCNRAAAIWSPMQASRGALLAVSQGRLRADTATHQHSLSQAVEQALFEQTVAQGLAWQRPGRWPLTLSVSASAEPGLARVQVCDPHQGVVNTRLLQRLFGLTPAEATATAALCDGHSAAHTGRLLGVQANTVNAHLKKALAKTGTTRQAELVALVLRSVAVCHTGPRP